MHPRHVSLWVKAPTPSETASSRVIETWAARESNPEPTD
jgi:hypothetical protein